LTVVTAPAENLVMGSSDVLDTLLLLPAQLPTILKDLPVFIEKLPMLHAHEDESESTGVGDLVGAGVAGKSAKVNPSDIIKLDDEEFGDF